MDSNEPARARDFIRQRIAADLAAGKNDGRVHTRFPPEPNGYLHIGHAKAICLNFGIAQEFGGVCNLRFDDTNPETESEEYVEAIKEDVRWLGFDWGDRLFYASDWFDRLYADAVKLVEKGLAYVDQQTPEQIAATRGTPTEPGTDSPYRDRPIEENLRLLDEMRRGMFEEGACVLRAKIDMKHPNVHMRDPVMYRIKKTAHHRTGTKWCIYPMYDWAHGQNDSYEGITHSLCTLEFEVHRPLYDWFLDQLGIHHPQQIEFARLEVATLLTSKRKLKELVDRGIVTGWDDPRMPTLRGLRRRGYSPAALRAFCEAVGVAKFNARHEMQLLEHCLREDLNKTSLRALAVLDPLAVVIENWPEGQVEWLDAANNPEDPGAGTRKVPFSGRLWIERDDFLEDAPKKFYRLSPGREVRLRFAYFLKCESVVKDAQGRVVELRCTYDPASKGMSPPPERGIKATIHWVSAAHAIDAEVRLYDRLFTVDDPGSEEDWLAKINPDSLKVVRAKVEPSLADAPPGARYQFERIGYFCVDTVDSKPGAPVFNRTVGLRDEWAKVKKSG
ncbi:MAG TPA: glutamine--tRNA ligase/YqeY domain fusion protein [Planctomycetota bacterium]|nr:glutamine--tRNA ligase/YqeY domain fusion protein [Planctomycetota bacterium]